MFFEFNQNNSGGGFDYDESAGISHVVIIEADDADHANERAREIGIYFDGADDDGPDCACCGDRWYLAYDKGDDVPSIYGQPVEDFEHSYKWISSGYETFVHYADGRIVGHHGPEVKKI